jgi:hypothetical protein
MKELIDKLFPHVSNLYDEEEIIKLIEKKDIRYLSECFIITDKIIINIIKVNPGEIQYIENPPVKLQRMCLEIDNYSFKYFCDIAPYKIKKLAIEKSVSNLRYIKNPSPKLCHFAIQKGGYAIEYIKNPSLELQKLAVRKHPSMIQYIKNPNFEVVIDCVRRDRNVIKFVNLLNLTAEELEILKLVSI